MAPPPKLLLVLAVLWSATATLAAARRVDYTFNVKMAKRRVLCKEKEIMTVNGQYPGPTIYANEGQTIHVKVINHVAKNITIHWHGLRQPRYPWTDGPVYVTQCPIQPGKTFIQKLVFTKENGTLWWHAHTGYDRWSIHGAIVVRPRQISKMIVPFSRQQTVILGEWYDVPIEEIEEEELETGGGIPNSDANVLNGYTGDEVDCPGKDKTLFTMKVQRGLTYMLRLINAAMDNSYFFGIGAHNLTVVGWDGSPVEPLNTNYITITPGQTMDVIFTADRPCSNSRYYMKALYYQDSTANTFNKSSATGIIEYPRRESDDISENIRSLVAEEDDRCTHSYSSVAGVDAPVTPVLPDTTDYLSGRRFFSMLKSPTSASPVDVPREISVHMRITVAMNMNPCPNGPKCPDIPGYPEKVLSSSVNNHSYVAPRISVLNAYYHKIPGIYTPDFPDKPPLFFNFTRPSHEQPTVLLANKRTTSVKVLEYNTTVEVVFQGTSIVGAQTHPMHLHGYSFYVVGYGTGTFDEIEDPKTYNLFDPPYANTVNVPIDGWVAIRFKASNPGVWFMHCHFERHVEWGMATVFIVRDGLLPEEKMLPPPEDMPEC